VICALAGIVVGDTSGNSNCISVWMAGIQSTGESLLNPAMLRNSQYIIAASGMASISLYVAAATLAANALLLKLRAKSVWPAYVMAAIAIAEVSLFAVGNLPTFPTSSLVNQPVNTFLHANLGDGRILLTGNPDMSIPLKASNIWGYDSFHLNRYAEFVAYANGTDPDDSVARNALHWTRLQHLDALLGILRWKYLVAMDENGARIVPVSTLFPPGAYHMLPRLCLMDRYITAPGRNSQFELMSNGHIDLQQTAIVESLPAPLPLPGKGPAGFVRIVQESDDSMVIEGDLVRPAILVIADTYAKGWQAESLSGSSQRSYDLKPVDYTLRGIAMQAGHQRLRVAFVPLGLRLGEVVSACGIAGYLIGLGLYLRLAAVRKIRSR